MLKGVLDCPDLPLNVSRSYLQNNGYVTKISNHITKKVADKLTSMFNLQRENYEKQWHDLKTFVEYGCLRDPKFYSKVEKAIVYEKNDGNFVTLDEYLDKAKGKHENRIYYAQDKIGQAGYISMFEKNDIDVILLPHLIDTQFCQLVESKNEGVKFLRVDSEIADSMKGDDSVELEAVKTIFKSVVPDNVEIKFQALKDSTIPAVLNVTEDSRRMEDFMKMYRGMGNDAPVLPAESVFVLNSSCDVITSLETKSPEKAAIVAKHIYNLCLLTQGRLNADSLKDFLSDSYNILSLI